MTVEEKIYEIADKLREILDPDGEGWVSCATAVVIDDLIRAGVCFRESLVKEICCKIEAEIVSALESNYSARRERIEKWKDANAYIGGDFVSICDGKIAALRGIEDFIEELKDSYVEGKNG